ncbi:MAG: Lrp/AsnC family transcriptional regulator [archaeon]
MVKLDDKDRKIIRQLIRNPRNSDNRIAKQTGIPVMTVNRRRKELEKRGILNYYVYVKHSDEGLRIFGARQMYIIKFKCGLTREEYLNKMTSDTKLEEFYTEHIVEEHLGERDGHLALVILIEADTGSSLVECFNGIIVPKLKQKFGADCIEEIRTAKITHVVRQHHNYLPGINIKDGVIRPDWQDEWIFVDGQ